MQHTVLGLLALLFLSGCAKKHPEFTQPAVLRLEVGMTTDQVQALFGAPDEIRMTTCGQETKGGAWSCLVWTYEMGGDFGLDTNDLFFNAEVSPPRLSSWDFDTIYPGRP